ncbi:hypothetical protein [Ornithobacterium rhinotracheale]|uniref:hypothetical protein n=1 Tax=Ornithobacterium rhinotracheale TaxID=28251 RepID=UPI004035EDB5
MKTNYFLLILFLFFGLSACDEIHDKEQTDENGVLYVRGHFLDSPFCSTPILMLRKDTIIDNERLSGVYLKNIKGTEINFKDTYLVKFKLLDGKVRSCTDFFLIKYKDAHAISIKKIEK